MSIVIDIELATDAPDENGNPWDSERRLYVDRRTNSDEAWLTIHASESDDEMAVCLTPQRARDIAVMLAVWADAEEQRRATAKEQS